MAPLRGTYARASKKRVSTEHFSNYIIKFLGPTPSFLYLKNCDISSQIQQKRPSQTLAVAPYAQIPKKLVSTETKTRSFR